MKDKADPQTAVARARAREPGRGREADHPAEIPSLGWRDIFWRLVWSIPEDRVLSTGGSVAFFALLAVFPGAHHGGVALRPPGRSRNIVRDQLSARRHGASGRVLTLLGGSS